MADFWARLQPYLELCVKPVCIFVIGFAFSELLHALEKIDNG